jgi:transitional endoplasmic reticulum ATPase
MDGVVGSTSKVLCIGSTNRIEFLDSAILRPGRLDFHLLIPNPDEQARMTLFELFLGRMPVDSSITYDTLVEKTAGYSAAEIEFICKESGLNSLKRVYQITDLLKSSDPIDMSKVVVTMQDVLLAFDNKSLQRYKS